MEEPREVYIEWGPEPPTTYARDRIVAMVRDPEVFVFYWDVSDPEAEHVARVVCLSQGRRYDVDLPRALHVWYVPAESNETYRAELLRRGPDGELERLAVSRDITLPVEHAWQADAKPAELAQAEREPIARSLQARAAEAPAPPDWPGSVPAPPPPELQGGAAAPRRLSTPPSTGSSDYVNFGQEA